jgi:multiple sugar transport system permease protein
VEEKVAKVIQPGWMVKALGRLLNRKRMKTLRSLFTGLAFISPWLAGFLLFNIYAIAASFYYSFTYYDIIRSPKFIGLGNYIELFTDGNFYQTLGNTVYYVVFAVPGSLVVSFSLAYLLNQKLIIRPFWRTIFYLPSVVPQFAVAMVWQWIYHPRFGLINSYLAANGIKGIPWLSSPDLAKFSLVIVSLWLAGGGMLIFLAALQDVPRSLIDAAKIDGASAFQELRQITIPIVTPAILFNLIMGMIGAFQYFTLAWIMTGGGPMRATEFYGLYLYRTAFQNFRMGYASSLAWILFLISVLGAVAIFRSSARWVYYGGGEGR